MKNKRINIDKLSREELLNARICDLGLTLQDSRIQGLIERLYQELSSKGLRFKPHVWVSTSWFCPYGVPGFALPFYLLHPSLCALEREWFSKAEGEDDEWCMQLLRHEAGHAIDNAFLLRKSKKRQAIFGLSSTPYPDYYVPKPYSKNFVRNLKANYAQAHPDEDWAETFAVWLDPKSEWKSRYQNWGAKQKLLLVDQLLQGVQGVSQPVFNREKLEPVESCTMTVLEYLQQKKRKSQRRQAIPQYVKPFYEVANNKYADDLKRNQKLWRQKLASFTKEHNYLVSQALRELNIVSVKSGYQLKTVSHGEKVALTRALARHVKEFVRKKRHRILM